MFDFDPAVCANCGAPRSPELINMANRIPCECGATSLNMGGSVQESPSRVIDSISAELIPKVRPRNWRSCWEQIQAKLENVTRPRTVEMTGESVYEWQKDLESFYVQAYHLKDALKLEAHELGLDPQTVENAISNSSKLSLLADIANLVKHHSLIRQPRSGNVPEFLNPSGVDCSQEGGWLLSAKIRHDQLILDGIELAIEFVNEWRQLMSDWEI